MKADEPRELHDHDRLGIIALYARYNQAIDAGDPDAWAATFLPTGVFHHPARNWTGTEELRQFVVQRTAGFDAAPRDMLHWNDTIRIEAAPECVRGSCRLLVSGRDRATDAALVVASGRYVDELQLTSEGWRFASRRLSLG